MTSVIRSITGDSGKAVSYHSFYDSLNPADSPSRAIAGDLTLGGVIPNAEALFVTPLVLHGYNVVIPDTEGQTADFAAGPEYGTTTLDSIRAATEQHSGDRHEQRHEVRAGGLLRRRDRDGLGRGARPVVRAGRQP